MALLGISLIVASVVLFCMRRPAWFASLFGGYPQPAIESPARRTGGDKPGDRRSSEADGVKEDGFSSDSARSPLFPPPVIRHTPADSDVGPESSSCESADDEQSTPKASAATLVDKPVPAFSLSAPEPPATISKPAGLDTKPAVSLLPSSSPPTSASASTLMAPPPRPPTLRPTPSATSTSSSISSPSLASPQARNLPIPARGPGCSTLAPPPTHNSKPAKPSRAVVLSPGHSPLDWARLSSDPSADLRGLPPGSPYLRVTPSMLKKMTGRKGKDAWTVLGGRVYNVTPYLPFHPGGEPEVLRGAGRDGTKLFGEIHPWVNYEGMLAACLVGIYVPEEEGTGTTADGAAGSSGDMDAMD